MRRRPGGARRRAAPRRWRGAGGRGAQDRAETLAAFEEPLPEALVLGGTSGNLEVGSLGGENVLGGRVRLAPGLAVYFNDPSGALKYELSAIATYDRPLARQTFFQAE